MSVVVGVGAGAGVGEGKGTAKGAGESAGEGTYAGAGTDTGGEGTGTNWDDGIWDNPLQKDFRFFATNDVWISEAGDKGVTHCPMVQLVVSFLPPFSVSISNAQLWYSATP